MRPEDGEANLAMPFFEMTKIIRPNEMTTVQEDGEAAPVVRTMGPFFSNS